MAPCKRCGAPTIFDSDVGLVCTGCGELVNPERVVLTSDADYAPPSTSEGWISAAHKAIKTGRNRYLGSQDKEARDSKHLEEMHSFIKNLARAAFVSSMTERAFHLFQQAMTSGEWRWGRAAKLVAGACISITLRLNSRPEMFADLAALLGEKTHVFARTFSSVLSVLKIDNFPPSEPKSHVAMLQAHLARALESTESGLTSSLVAVIKPLSLSEILATATALSELLVSSVPPSAVTHLPVSPTACAVLVWAIEAEARTSITQLGDLAAFLGNKCKCTKSGVMGRYKIIQDELIERIDKIPWLDHYVPGGGGGSRAKISRRVIAARGVKAVIEHEREFRREEFQSNSGEGESDCGNAFEGRRKRRRVHAVQNATQFLLNPLLGPLPESFTPSPTSRSPALPLPTYLLTSALAMRRDNLPSRLQLLSLSRGGVSASDIHDDELFDDGELEKMLRTEEEMEELRKTLGWEEGNGVLEGATAVQEPLPERRKRGANAVQPTISSRLNAAAVSIFFAGDKSDDDLGGLLQLDDSNFVIEEDGDVTNTAFIGLPRTLMTSATGDEGMMMFSPSPSPEPDDGYAEEL